jgi:hypothetical protein
MPEQRTSRAALGTVATTGIAIDFFDAADSMQDAGATVSGAEHSDDLRRRAVTRARSRLWAPLQRRCCAT